MNLPRASVIILNYNGLAYLDRCLKSAVALDYPADAHEVILCDNGSSDGSAAYVRANYPQVRVVELERNYGFAEGNNRAAREARYEWIAFLNNDMWFEPEWLRQMASAIADHPGVECVSGKIVNWDGSRIDFVGSGATFEGHGYQVDHGARESANDVERRIIAPCGGAMMMRKERFLALDGFDQSYFSFFEDTDLGWRLNLLGCDVWYTPRATTYHLAHATASRFPRYRLRVLYERNALFTIYKNLDDANLAAALPAALLLMNERALRLAGIKLDDFRLAERRRQPRAEQAGGVERLSAPRSLRQKARDVLDDQGWGGLAKKAGRAALWRGAAAVREPLLRGGSFVPSVSLSHYIAMHDFAASLETLKEKRRWVQEHRVRSDAELMPLFRNPLRPTWDDRAYVRFYNWLTKTLGLTERFPPAA